MPKIISRDEARRRNKTRFFTGKPCKHGHVAERYVNGPGVCIECTRRSHKSQTGAGYQPPPSPATPPPPREDVTEIAVGRSRVLRIQRLEDMVLVIGGQRLQRAATEAVSRSGVIIFPASAHAQVVKAIQQQARR